MFNWCSDEAYCSTGHDAGEGVTDGRELVLVEVLRIAEGEGRRRGCHAVWVEECLMENAAVEG